jgi:hypothetical protein
VIGRGPKCRRGGNLGREWLQIRWREWFVYRVQRHFATVGKVRSFRVDTDLPRRIGWLCSSGRLYSNRCGVPPRVVKERGRGGRKVSSLQDLTG